MSERQPEFDKARARLIQQLRQRSTEGRVLEAMELVPRHLFVPAGLRHQAYDDRPLPLGAGQTISQPSMVALMTQALAIGIDDVILEVGTGSGYQAAILAELAKRVFSVERIPSLAEKAKDLLLFLGYHNIEVSLAGPTLGWESRAPFDRILVTAAAPYVPQALLNQLKSGGRMVIPVGSRSDQELIAVTMRGDQITRQSLAACRFVPLIGKEAWAIET